MKICLQIPTDNKYVVACSFGPDSMALLDAAYKAKLNIVVAHVNYHHRDVSDNEEKQLKSYCKERKIKIEVLWLYDEQIEGNFEAWAREKRYQFFKEIVEKNHADAVLVGHHQDDLIETYLMQQKRGNFVKNQGIAAKTTIFSTEIIRPLLGYTKKELLDYCTENNVPYSIDITNLSDDYERNKIRHEIIEKLTPEKCSEILGEIKAKTSVNFEAKNKWTAEEFSKLSYEEIVLTLDHFMNKKNEHRNLSKMFVKEIQKFAVSKKANCELKITDKLVLAKSYKNVWLVDEGKLIDYSLKLNEPGELKTNFLDAKIGFDSSDRNITKGDFPLTIRNAKIGDKILISGNNKNLNRLFLDWKMPKFVRKVWPVIENKDGKLIYIPRYREEFVDNHKTKFVIDIDAFLAH